MRETVQGVKRVGPRRSKSVPAPVVRPSGPLRADLFTGTSRGGFFGGRRLQVGDLVGLRDRLGVLL